jgi:hypothetical protein
MSSSSSWPAMPRRGAKLSSTSATSGTKVAAPPDADTIVLRMASMD